MHIINSEDESGHPCLTPRLMLKKFEKKAFVDNYAVNIGIKKFNPFN